VGGLTFELLISIFLLPTLYCCVAGPADKLPPAEARFMEEGEHVD